MGHRDEAFEAMPVVRRLEDFDQRSGSALERLIFNRRGAVVAACAAVTLALGYGATTRLLVDADFDAMMPAKHPFVASYLENRGQLRGLGNTLHVVLENRRGDIYDAAYLDALRDLTDELFLLPGVDRAWVRSLWMPAVRWSEVTEEGFRGGPVLPVDGDGPAALAQVRRNVARSGVVGTLVATDERSSAVFVPLVDRDPATGDGLRYRGFAQQLEDVRRRFEERGGGRFAVHVVGFAKLVGDLLAAQRQVVAWFAAAAAVACAIVFLYTRCVRSTVLVVACSALAVVWQLGIVAWLRIPLDPFSILVPFLAFALGISHGTQKMNGIVRDVARGTHRLVAARYTFRRLFLAGLTALLTDAVGFAVLAIIPVQAIRHMALTATIGACVLVFTNLVLLPVLLSYTGVSVSAAARRGASDDVPWLPWRALATLTQRRRATVVLGAGAVVIAAALVAAPLAAPREPEPGAPELRPASRYNRDAAFVAAHYAVSSDVFAVLVKTPDEGCLEYRTLVEADRLAWSLQQLPVVRSTVSLPDAVRQITADTFEGNPQWYTLSRNQQILDNAVQQAMTRAPDLVNARCSVMPVVAYLSDHAPDTLRQVTAAADRFAREHSRPERRFVLAAGSAGLQAATNLVVEDARWTMTACVYAAVILLCFAVFRSWRAVLVTIVPLAFTSVLCDALMTVRGTATDLATLPVIALGVGIPDFALYLLTIQLAHQRSGASLGEAYSRSLRFTGKAVVLVSVMLAAGVFTWTWSPIRLQAEMGFLLTFMFLGNMVAALALVPALSSFLLGGIGPEPVERPLPAKRLALEPAPSRHEGEASR